MKLFDSFESAFNYYQKGTNYEQKNGIEVISSKIAIDITDFKLVIYYKSDVSATLVIFFKTSKSLDSWAFWCPSEEQMLILNSVRSFYDLVEFKNSKHKIK